MNDNQNSQDASIKATGHSSQGTEVQVRIADGPLRTGVVRDGVLFVHQNPGDAQKLGRIRPRRSPMSPYADAFLDITIFEDDYPGSPLIREFSVIKDPKPHPSETDAATEESIDQMKAGWETTIGEDRSEPAEPVDVQMLRVMTEIRDLAKDMAAKTAIPPHAGPFYHYVPPVGPPNPFIPSAYVGDRVPSTSEESAKKAADPNRMFVVPEPEYGSFAITDTRVHIDLPREQFANLIVDAVLHAYEAKTGTVSPEFSLEREERRSFGRRVWQSFFDDYTKGVTR